METYPQHRTIGNISEVCDKYDVHLIIDEVWCSTGTSGKVYCVDWDEITPDFIFLGKTLGAGYVPISAVITSSNIENIIKSGTGRLKTQPLFKALFSFGSRFGRAERYS